MVRPFCMTSMEMPRLLSEYFAARAQSAARNSAKAVIDVAMRRKPAKNASDFMIPRLNRRTPRWWGFEKIQVGEVGAVCSVATGGCERGLTGKYRFRNSSTLGNSSKLRRPK